MIETILEFTCDLCGKQESVRIAKNPANIAIHPLLPKGWVTEMATCTASMCACGECLKPYQEECRLVDEQNAKIYAPASEAWKLAHAAASPRPLHPLRQKLQAKQALPQDQKYG